MSDAASTPDFENPTADSVETFPDSEYVDPTREVFDREAENAAAREAEEAEAQDEPAPDDL